MRCVNLLLTLAFLSTGVGKVVMAQEHAPATITRLYTGSDGMSHFEQVNVKFSPVPGAPDTVEESEPLSMKKSYVVRIAPGFFEDWHNADVRRYVITISGRSEVEVAGGRKLIAQPGQVVLAEDLTGKGHTFRVLGGSDWVALFVDMEK
jgi:quercetin dioxygenase-like cupin family protein